MKSSLQTAERLTLVVGSVALLLIPLVYRSGGFQFANYPKLFFLVVVAAIAGACAFVLAYRGTSVSVFAPVLVFVAISMLQWTRSLNPAEAAIPLVALVGSVTLAFGVVSDFDEQLRNTLIRSLVLGAGLVGVAGLLETWGVPWAQWRSAGRPSATLGFRNTAATYAAGCLPWALYLMTNRDRIDRVGGAVTGAIVFLFVLYTRSRGAWLGLAVAVVALMVWQIRQGGWSVLIGRGVLAAGAVGALLVYLGSLAPAFDDTALSRLDEKKQTLEETVRSLSTPGGDRDRLATWSHTLAMAGDHALTGVGLGNWSAHYPAYDSGDVVHLQSAPRRPHNDYLWVSSELGVFSLALYVWILLSALITAIREREPWRLCAAVSLLIVAIHAFFSFPREQAATSMIYWFAIAICLAGCGRLPRKASLVVWGALCIACLVGVGGMYRALVADTHYSTALRAQRDGATNQQLEAALKAVLEGTFDHRALLVLADAQEATGDRDGAFDTYSTYENRQPYLAAIRNNVGHLLNQVERYPEAEIELKKGLDILPADRTLISNLSESIRRQGRTREAIGLYGRLSYLGAQEHENLGVLYSELDSVSVARNHYAKAISLDPTRGRLVYSVAGLDLIQGRTEQAVSGYERYLETENPHPTLVRRTKARLRQAYPALATQLQRTGRMQDALEALQKRIGLGETAAGDHHRLALAHGSLGQYQRAEEASREALRRDPSMALAWFTLANALYEQGNPSAFEAYESFVEMWKGDPKLLETARRRLRERR